MIDIQLIFGYMAHIKPKFGQFPTDFGGHPQIFDWSLANDLSDNVGMSESQIASYICTIEKINRAAGLGVRTGTGLAFLEYRHRVCRLCGLWAQALLA